MISNKYIQSVLAKAIGDAKFLDYLQNDKTAAGRLLGKNKALYASIRKFSAFICRVQHNFMLGEYPLTFMMLDKFKMNQAVFSGYLTLHQGLKLKKAPNLEKESLFTLYLTKYLSKRSAVMYKLMADTLNHESTLKSLRFRQQHNVQDLPKGKRLEFNIDLPIKPIGNYTLLNLHFNPREISLMKETGKNPRYHSKVRTYCYWLENGQRDATILEADPILVQALLGINGKNTVLTLMTKLEKKQEIATLLINFQMLFDMDLIFFAKKAVKTRSERGAGSID
ncbi:hypothetical protein ACX0G9_26885 [Flavitalea flava]